MNMHSIIVVHFGSQPLRQARRVLESFTEGAREENRWYFFVLSLSPSVDWQHPWPVSIGGSNGLLDATRHQGAAHLHDCLTRAAIAGGDRRNHVQNIH